MFVLMLYVMLLISYKGLGVDMVEFGLIVLFVIGLLDMIDLGVMIEVDVVGKDDGCGWRVNVVNLVMFGFVFVKWVGMYIELFIECGD